jgi:hypothetical protein
MRTDLADLTVRYRELFPLTFTQGARCGHVGGKLRVGLYVIGEEEMFSYDCAAFATRRERCPTPPGQVIAWALGYEAGYRLGAEGSGFDGSPLDLEIIITER